MINNVHLAVSAKIWQWKKVLRLQQDEIDYLTLRNICCMLLLIFILIVLTIRALKDKLIFVNCIQNKILP